LNQSYQRDCVNDNSENPTYEGNPEYYPANYFNNEKN